MIAAQRDTSVSALVKRYLADLGSGEATEERLKRDERALRERISAFKASDRSAWIKRQLALTSMHVPLGLEPSPGSQLKTSG